MVSVNCNSVQILFLYELKSFRQKKFQIVALLVEWKEIFFEGRFNRHASASCRRDKSTLAAKQQ